MFMLHATLLEANKLYHFLFLSAQTLERIHSTKLVFYAKKITQKLEFLFPQVSTHHFAKISSPLECSLLHSLTTSLKYRRACSLVPQVQWARDYPKHRERSWYMAMYHTLISMAMPILFRL